MERLINLYSSIGYGQPESCIKLTGGGSNREYYRLVTNGGGQSAIGVVGTSQEENRTFIELTKHFFNNGLPVPEILAISNDGMAYLQSDLGDISLYDALKKGRESSNGYSQKDVTLLEEAIKLLPKIQVLGGKGLDFSICYPQESMNEQNILFDLNYFKYCFLKTTSADFNEIKLEECFKEMAVDLGRCSENFFMYRDFQARNVMLSQGDKPYLIDYQGGRKGPLQYDLVSFLWQASSHFDNDLRHHLIDIYLEALEEYTCIDNNEFRRSIPKWVLFRTLQVLGAYGFRGKFEGKKYFLDSIPSAIRNLKEILLVDGACPYEYLYKVLSQMVCLPEFNIDNSQLLPSISSSENKGQLKVRIYSFSYKKGIPQDYSGNGGGYVFDCRSTHNPGRYEPYKKLTGLDKPVIDFLEEDGEIITFLDSVYKLADTHVSRYMERGFTSLMFCFGCTGGQHRSVYSAQHLGEYLHSKYGIEIEITHREQNIKSVLPLKRKAMIFAAGMGTRLKPLTDYKPKALVEIGGKPLIEHVIEKLVSNGFNDIVINIHHFADMIEKWGRAYLDSNNLKDRGLRIRFSDERIELLETGGGIFHASSLLTDCNPEKKFLVHNVDILSNLNISKFTDFNNNSTDALLVVSERKTSRYFVFDKNMRLVGWTNISTGEIKSPYTEVHETLTKREANKLDVGQFHLRAFAGIHQLNLVLLKEMASWERKFSITDFYIQVCDKFKIIGYEQENLKILDVGKLDSISEAEQLISNGF